jgi:hypothetical protein
MIALILLLATSIFEGIVEIPAGQRRPLPIDIDPAPATVRVDFLVVEGLSGVRVDLIRDEDAGEANPRALATTSFVHEDQLRLRLRDAGRYRVRVDNTLEHRAPARVQLKVEVEYHPPPPEAATIPEARQRAVVVLSLLLFGMIAGWSGRRLLAAARRRSGG